MHVLEVQWSLFLSLDGASGYSELAAEWLVDLIVLGLARTGLIFTRIQEGAQPGGLT